MTAYQAIYDEAIEKNTKRTAELLKDFGGGGKSTFQ